MATPKFALFTGMLLALTCHVPAQRLMAEEPAKTGAEWPQWRGPTRDGIAPPGPKLLEHWPTEGPKQVWKSDYFRAAYSDGGLSSIVVAEGKVIVYTNRRGSGKPVKVIASDVLKKWGWVEDMPEDLFKKIDAARAEQLKSKLRTGPNREAYIEKFIATLEPKLAARFGEAIKSRLTHDFLGHDLTDQPPLTDDLPNWSETAGAAKVADKEYDSYETFYVDLNKNIPLYHNSHGKIFFEFSVAAYPPWDVVICLDAKSGKTLWTKEFPGALLLQIGEQYWPASATPAISGGKCYVQGSAGFYCLALKDGAVVWQAKTGFSHSSPYVRNDVVYAMTPGLCAFNADTGKVLWTQDKGGAGNFMTSTSIVPWVHGDKFYLISAAGPPYCFDSETGKVVWEGKGGTNSSATPVFSSDYAFMENSGWKLTPQGAEKIYSVRSVADRGASPTIYQDHVYTHVDQLGGPYCHDLKTGVLKWKREGPKFGGECYSPIVADGKFIGTLGWPNDNSTCLIMYRANPEKYEELGVFKLRIAAGTSPAFVNGFLYLRLMDGVACYDLRETGVYLDGVSVKSDALTFHFAQTGGGLIAKDAANGELKDILITDAGGSAKPTAAKVEGENVVVNIKDVPIPFGISYSGTGALAGKNQLPAPAFRWNAVRILKFAKCFDQTIVLTSNLPLSAYWNDAANFAVAGAKVTSVSISAEGVKLTTDKTWKTGDVVSLTYPCFHVDQGEPRRETLKFTAPEVARATAKFVKTDETTSGGWKGVYGSEGAVVERDAGSTPPKCAVVTATNHGEHTWADTTPDTRALQKTGDTKDRIAACWYSASTFFDIDIGISDGKEHQVSIYLMDWDALGRAVKVEVRDAVTAAVLDTQTVADFKNGKYLIWNIKGQTSFHFISVGKENATVSGVFVDPPGPTGK